MSQTSKFWIYFNVLLNSIIDLALIFPKHKQTSLQMGKIQPLENHSLSLFFASPSMFSEMGWNFAGFMQDFWFRQDFLLFPTSCLNQKKNYYIHSQQAGQIKIIPKKYIGNWKSHSPTIIIYVNFWLEDVILWDFIAYSKLLYCFWDGVTALKWGQLFSEVAVHYQ